MGSEMNSYRIHYIIGNSFRKMVVKARTEKQARAKCPGVPTVVVQVNEVGAVIG